MIKAILRLLFFARAIQFGSAKIVDFRLDFGAIPFDESFEICQFNSALLSRVLKHNVSGNTLVIPEGYTFHVHHGIITNGLHDAVIRLDGVLRFERADLAIDEGPPPFPSCLQIDNSSNITITSKSSSGRGLIDGRGPQYWGVPMIGYIQLGENRPRLLLFNRTKNLLIERIILQDSPYHTLYLEGADGVVIRDISIVARRTTMDGHNWVDLTAFNTDGIDVSGHNVHVHDVDIWVQDDCISVKDNFFDGHRSTNMTFERINATGLGFVIGSILGSTVSNITFKDSYLHRPVKGIYMKFARPNAWWVKRNLTRGVVENIVYQNITMESPSQWPIWIGPAQQADASNPCHPNPCSLCWPMSPTAKCHIVQESTYRNIMLIDIQINNPKMSPGVLLGHEDNKIDGIVFDNVRVTKGRPLPMSRYKRENTFPGTLQPIHDPYVPGIVTTNDLVATKRRELSTASDLVWPDSMMPSNDEVNESNGFFSKWNPFWKPKWQKTNRYYACEGVSRGIVRGKSWPVPYCFEKERPSWSESILVVLRSTGDRSIVLLLAITLLALFYCFAM
jgi:hypothetical protein